MPGSCCPCIRACIRACMASRHCWEKLAWFSRMQERIAARSPLWSPQYFMASAWQGRSPAGGASAGADGAARVGVEVDIAISRTKNQCCGVMASSFGLALVLRAIRPNPSPSIGPVPLRFQKPTRDLYTDRLDCRGAMAWRS